MARRIHIMGASGVGTSTLGQELAKVLPHVQLDTDDYFWAQKFTKQTEINDRLTNLKQDLAYKEPWILSGAVCGWGDGLRPLFDLVIFLWVPQDIRMKRLKAREYGRYGDDILPGGSKYEDHQTFMAWAALYDTAGVEVRSKKLHEEWMSRLRCPVLRIEEDVSVKARVDVVLDYLRADDLGGIDLD